jgi:hypothetical protein
MENAVYSPSDIDNPLEELKRLNERLDRQEAIRRAKERQNQLAALSRYALNTPSNGSTES